MMPAGAGNPVHSVIAEVDRRFGVSADEVFSASRTRRILVARHVAVYLVQKLTGETPVRIGAQFGGRDYTSILMYIRAVARRRAEEQAFGTLLDEMEQAVR